MEKDILKNFFNEMEQKKYPVNATFIFVYNNYNTYMDDPHLEECFDDSEVHEIIDSISDIFNKVLFFGAEKEFVEWCSTQQNPSQRTYVYTMAQAVEGFGRRTLVPALCQYYGFINLNADTYMSAIGCNKETMYKLLKANGFNNILAPTIFCTQLKDINFEKIYLELGNHIILKPINESCCIDTYVLEDYSEEELASYASKLLTKYGHAMIQKYICGEEIGITVTWHNGNMHTLTPMQILFASGKKHLTHTDSFYGNYELKPCVVSEDLLETCRKMSLALGFHCITRYDFRHINGDYYLFDLSPNPTINGYTSSNYAARSTLSCDHRGILRLMVYEKFALFEPSLK